MSEHRVLSARFVSLRRQRGAPGALQELCRLPRRRLLLRRRHHGGLAGPQKGVQGGAQSGTERRVKTRLAIRGGGASRASLLPRSLVRRRARCDVLSWQVTSPRSVLYALLPALRVCCWCASGCKRGAASHAALLALPYARAHRTFLQPPRSSAVPSRRACCRHHGACDAALRLPLRACERLGAAGADTACRDVRCA